MSRSGTIGGVAANPLMVKSLMNTIATLEKDLQKHKETEYSIRSLIKLHLPYENIEENDPVQLLGIILKRMGDKGSSEKILTYNYNITKNSTSHSTSLGDTQQPSVRQRSGNPPLKRELDESATSAINQAVNNIKDAQNLRQTSSGLGLLLDAFKDILTQNYEGAQALQTKDNIEEIQEKIDGLTSTPPPKQGVQSSTISTLKQITLPKDENENITNVDTERIYTTIINIVQYAYDNSENLEFVKEYIRRLQRYTKALQVKLLACYGVVQIIGKCLKENKIVFNVTILPDGNYICSVIEMLAKFVLTTEAMLQLEESNTINIETIESLENAIKLYKTSFKTTCKTLLDYFNKNGRKDDDDYRSAQQLEHGQNDEPTNIIDTRDLENISATIVRVIQKLINNVGTNKLLKNQYQQQVNNLTNEIDDLKGKLESFISSDYQGVIALLETSKTQLQIDFNSLKETMNKYKSLNNELMKTNSELNEKIRLNEKVFEERNNLKEAYARLNEDYKILQKKIDALEEEKNEECQTIKDELKKAQKEIDSLNKNLGDKINTIEQMERDNLDNINSHNKIEASLKNQLRIKDEDIDNLRMKLDSVEQQCSASVASKDEVNRYYEQVQRQLETQRYELTNTIKEKDIEIENLKTEIANLTTHYQQSATYNQQVTKNQRESMRQLTTMGLENETLKEKLKELETTIKMKNDSIADLRTQIVRADTEIRRNNINNDDIQNLEQQINNIKRKNEKLREQNESLADKYEKEASSRNRRELELSTNLEQLQAEIISLRDKLNEEVRVKETKNKEYQEFILKEKQYQDKIKQLEDTIVEQTSKKSEPALETRPKTKAKTLATIRKASTKFIKKEPRKSKPLPTGPITALITPNVHTPGATEAGTTTPRTSQTTGPTITEPRPGTSSLEGDIKAKTKTIAESRPSIVTGKRKLDEQIETIAKKINTEPELEPITQEEMENVEIKLGAQGIFVENLESKLSSQEIPTLISTSKPS